MFYSDKFSFDGISNDVMGVSLVSQDSGVLNEHGINFTQDVTNISNNKSPMYETSVSSSDTIGISLCYERDGSPMSWSIAKRAEIIGWMVQDDFKPFVSMDDPSITYFLKCVGYTKEFDSSMRGIITFEMQSYSPYSYVREIIKSSVNGTSSINIINQSNVGKYFAPIFKITPKSNGTVTIGELTVECESGNTVTIDNELCTISDSKSKSVISKSNRKWVRLNRGVNTLSVNGVFDIEIDCLYPILV